MLQWTQHSRSIRTAKLNVSLEKPKELSVVRRIDTLAHMNANHFIELTEGMFVNLGHIPWFNLRESAEGSKILDVHVMGFTPQGTPKTIHFTGENALHVLEKLKHFS
jgi:hypothetical protein